MPERIVAMHAAHGSGKEGSTLSLPANDQVAEKDVGE